MVQSRGSDQMGASVYIFTMNPPSHAEHGNPGRDGRERKQSRHWAGRSLSLSLSLLLYPFLFPFPFPPEPLESVLCPASPI